MNDALPANIAPPPAWYEQLPRLPLRVAAIGRGEAILAGELRDPVTMGVERLVSKGGVDLFVSRMDASGKHLWAEAFGGPSQEAIRYGKDGSFQWKRRYGGFDTREARVVAVDEDGSLFVHQQDESGPVMYLHKLSPSGDPLWSKDLTGKTGSGFVVAYSLRA